MRTIRLSRRVKTLKIWATSAEHHNLITGSGELERVDLAPLLQAPAEGVEHLLAPVADPLLTQPLPSDLGIEQRRRGVEVASPERAEEVDHDRLEVLLGNACHGFLLCDQRTVTTIRSRVGRCPRTAAEPLGREHPPRRQPREDGRLTVALASARHAPILRSREDQTRRALRALETVER